MKHARNDYNRFQEPQELMEFIYKLAATASQINTTGGTPEWVNEEIERLNQKYKIDSSSTPIGEDEPVFLLRAKDKYFIPMLQIYDLLASTDGDMSSDQQMIISDSLRDHTNLAVTFISEVPTVPENG